MQIKTLKKVSYKFILTLWVSKCPTGWYYHNWWAWSSILKLPKVISLQYLYNVLVVTFIFCMHINIKVSISWHYRFWWKWLDMSKYPEYFYCDVKYSDIFWESNHVCCYLLRHWKVVLKYFGLVLHPLEIWGLEDKLDN